MGCMEERLRSFCGIGYLAMGATTIVSSLLALAFLCLSAMLVLSPSGPMVKFMMFEIGGSVAGPDASAQVAVAVMLAAVFLVIGASAYTLGRAMGRISRGSDYRVSNGVRAVAVTVMAMGLPLLAFRIMFLGIHVNTLVGLVGVCLPFVVIGVAVLIVDAILRRKLAESISDDVVVADC